MSVTTNASEDQKQQDWEKEKSEWQKERDFIVECKKKAKEIFLQFGETIKCCDIKKTNPLEKNARSITIQTRDKEEYQKIIDFFIIAKVSIIDKREWNNETKNSCPEAIKLLSIFDNKKKHLEETIKQLDLLNVWDSKYRNLSLVPNEISDVYFKISPNENVDIPLLQITVKVQFDSVISGAFESVFDTRKPMDGCFAKKIQFKKVVINACYGGFSLSKKAEMLYKEKGIEEKKKEQNKNTVETETETETKFHSRHMARDDPILIQIVEEIGPEANGKYAELVIKKVAEYADWSIDEYDGAETLISNLKSLE